MRTLGFIPSKNGIKCEDTKRVFDFLPYLRGFIVEEAEEGSQKALNLRRQAEEGRFFDDRQDEGHPLVVVIEDGNVIWAACAPSQGELYEALYMLSSTVEEDELLAELGRAQIDDDVLARRSENRH